MYRYLLRDGGVYTCGFRLQNRNGYGMMKTKKAA